MFRPQDKEQTNETGMSIIEVMVSMVITGVVLVGLGQGLVLGIRMNVESKARIANLSVAKRVMESVKSQAQFSQGLFDGACDNSSFNKTFYADANGNEIEEKANSSEGATSASASKTQTIPEDAAYEVVVAVNDWADSTGDTLSATDSDGDSHVLVKVLTVRVQTRQSALLSNSAKQAAARAVTVTVEMVRPAV